MRRTVVFTRQNTESCSIAVDVDGSVQDAVDAAFEKLHSANPGWEPADRCFDDWEEYYVANEEGE